MNPNDETQQNLAGSTSKRRYDEDMKEDEKFDSDDKSQKRPGQKVLSKLKKGGDKAQTDVVPENIKKVDKKKSQSDVNFIINCLKNHFVFYNLSENELENIVSKMFYCKIGAQEYIFKQGDNASSYFILERGTLEVIVNEKPKRELRTGDGFGELALLYNAPRSASVRTLENCELWGIDRNTFRRAVEEMITKEYEENRKFIEAVRFFNAMTSEQKDAVASVLITLKFAKGQSIVNEGDPASSFYIIKEGSVVVLKGNKEVRKMVKGDSFGEQALYYNTVRGATVKALDSNVKCLALGRDTLIRVLGDQVQVITFKNQQKWALEKSPILSKLTKTQIEKVVDVMKIMNYKAGEVIYAKSSFCHQKIVAIIEGALKKSKFGTVVATKGTPFGDEYLMETNKTKIFDDDIVMECDGVLSEINYESFQECIGGAMEEVLKKNEKAHEKRMINVASDLKKIAGKIKLEELIFYRKLGYGQFGSVYLVREKNHEQFFALKSISKQQIVEGSLEKHIQQERNVLEMINFPFIMQYIRTYKDMSFVYFLTEFIKGMELFDVIREIGLLNTYDAQFYVGSIILCIEYLHNQGIVYRDLKPENLMVDQNGYTKLIDFGTSKVMKKQGPGAAKTFTIIGTPHYMAPEIIAGKGYGPPIDLWSIGICLYEFMCGVVPFGEDAEDPYDIYEEIFTQPLKYPAYLKDKKAKRLMEQLIHKYPEVRLGGSFAALKANPWFENFDWDKLIDKELKAPYIPQKEKLIPDTDIKRMEGLARKVIAEIEEDQKNLKRYSKDQAADPNWDKNF